MYFNCISTASFIALNKRGVKNEFQLHYWQYKIDTFGLYFSLLFSTLVESAILKKNKSRLH